MPKLSKLVSPFAHYLGLGGSAAAADEKDDERCQGDDESDEDYAKRMEELDDEEARKAEEEKKQEEARRAEEEEKEREAKRAKKAKGEDGDDDADMEAEDDADDKEEGKRAGRAKGARQRERIRCAKILAAGVKAGRVNQACVFAFDSSLTASAAIAALGAADLDAPKQVAARPSRLSERMNATPIANPGADGAAASSANPAKALADRIVAVAERVRGK